MIKIISFLLSKLRNGEYFQFITDLKDLITTFTPTALNVEEEYAEFEVAYAKLDEELNTDKGSKFTEMLYTQDSLRDNTWTALNERVKATLMCPIAKEVEAAKNIKRIFDLYGNIRKLSYNEETAACTNLSTDLDKAENAADCATIGITKWANALKKINIDFKAVQNQRDTESSNKNSGNVKEVRLVLDPLYEEIINRVNAMVTLKMATPEIETFVKEVNQKIKVYETTLAARQGRNDSGNDDEIVLPTPDEVD